MADINLTQDEADKLMAMEKRSVDERDWLFPIPGDRIAIQLTSLDKRENFMLDVTRAQIMLTKATYQNRARAAIILMRLDLDGPPHRNPDGEEVPCPHLHIYREGFGDKWAIPAPVARYTNTLDLFSTCDAFMQHCNITDPPKIQRGLFS
jgi:MoaA/NifB/PqqE/SkfB family radical SAM enzyme